MRMALADVRAEPLTARLHRAWPRLRGLTLACLGGVAFALTSPPTDFYPMVLVGLALLAASIDDAPTAWRAFGRGVVWGTSAGLLGFRFVPVVIQRFTTLGAVASFAALLLLAAGQSLVWAIGAAAAHLARRRARAPLPLAFGAGTLIAVSLPSIFVWTPAGLVSPWPVFVQLADVIGERGVSVLFAVAAALFVLAARRIFAGERRPALYRASAASAILLGLVAYGVIRMRTIEVDGTPSLRVGLVDQAVGPLDRWDPKNHAAILHGLKNLTRDAEAEGAELTVWPEAAYPYPLDHGLRRAPTNSARSFLGDGVRGPVLAGLILYDRPLEVAPGVVERRSYNSATMVTADGAMQAPYDKLELLWFGETVPFASELPWLRRMFQKSGGLFPGTEPRPLTLARSGVDDVRIGVLNCYEDTLPWVGRRVANALAPSLLVNITNDAWFFGTAEPELHARLATMRAIENRIDLVRAVNMGVASWIDARGVVRARRPSDGEGVLLVTPSVRPAGSTLYASLGDRPALFLLSFTLLACAWRTRPSLPREAPSSSPESAAPARESSSEAPSRDGAPPEKSEDAPADDALHEPDA